MADSGSDYTYWMPVASKSSLPRRKAGKPLSRPAVPPKISAPWSLRSSGNLRILELDAFKKLPWLLHGFSTAPGGVSDLDGQKSLNLGFTDWDTRENVIENRKRFQTALGAQKFPLINLKQIHSAVIWPFASVPKEPCNGDASLTNTPGLLLGVRTADCVPILLVDPKKRAVAAVHAGWRGTLARILEKAVGELVAKFKSHPSDLLAAIGPAIGPCCYEVGAELVIQFTSQFAAAADYFDEPRSGEEPNPLQWLNMMPPGHQPPPKNVRLDLPKANRAQLLAAGVHEKNIFSSGLCTACHPSLFFSYRKQGPRSGRLLAAIALKK
ncbi:MAG TPA: peptidoglycan editing factor PgeF [Candidatus Dormibacteraeota bacterium]|nr:peptidoglycan editing factor PgeF [Candidatus Dormibacteraeota bacterium]